MSARLTVVLAVTLMLGGLLTPVQLLTVDELGICRRVRSGDSMILGFTNSMFGGWVREDYRVDGEHLIRDRFVTELAASAEYYAWDRGITPIEGGYEVDLPDVSFASIPVKIDDIGNYVLSIEAESIPLTSDDLPRSIRIELDTTPLVVSWIRGC